MAKRPRVVKSKLWSHNNLQGRRGRALGNRDAGSGFNTQGGEKLSNVVATQDDASNRGCRTKSPRRFNPTYQDRGKTDRGSRNCRSR